MTKRIELTATKRFDNSTKRSGAITGLLLLTSGDKLLLVDGSSNLKVTLDAQPYQLTAEGRKLTVTAPDRAPRDIERAIPRGFFKLTTGDYLLLTDGASKIIMNEIRTPYLLTV